MSENTKTAPTLRELLDGNQPASNLPEGQPPTYYLDDKDIVQIEAELLAPLRAEISQLRSKVAAANTLRNVAQEMVNTRFQVNLHPLLEAVANYDTAPAGEDEEFPPSWVDGVTIHLTEGGEWQVAFMSDADNGGKRADGFGPTRTLAWANAVADVSRATPPAVAPVVNDAQHAVAEKISAHIKATRSSGVYPTSENARELLAMVDTFYELKSSAATPPAVADDGETGEGHVWDADWPMDVVTVNDRLDYLCAISDQQSTDHNAHVIATAEHLAALRRDVTQLEAFAAGSIEPTAALRRDVDALNNTIGERSNNLDRVFNSFMARLEFLESRERPEPGGVRDVGAVAALNAWHGVSEYNYSKRQIEQMREAINIALAAEAGR